LALSEGVSPSPKGGPDPVRPPSESATALTCQVKETSTSQPPPIVELAAELLSAENPPENIQIYWNEESSED